MHALVVSMARLPFKFKFVATANMHGNVPPVGVGTARARARDWGCMHACACIITCGGPQRVATSTSSDRLRSVVSQYLETS